MAALRAIRRYAVAVSGGKKKKVRKTSSFLKPTHARRAAKVGEELNLTCNSKVKSLHKLRSLGL